MTEYPNSEHNGTQHKVCNNLRTEEPRLLQWRCFPIDFEAGSELYSLINNQFRVESAKICQWRQNWKPQLSKCQQEKNCAYSSDLDASLKGWIQWCLLKRIEVLGRRCGPCHEWWLHACAACRTYRNSVSEKETQQISVRRPSALFASVDCSQDALSRQIHPF